jgi:hypothetical protein
MHKPLAEDNFYDERGNAHTPVAAGQHTAMATSTEKTEWLTAIQLYLHPLNLTILNSYISLSSCDREIRLPEIVTIVQYGLGMST